MYYVGMKLIAQGEAVFSHVYVYAVVAIISVIIGLAGFLSNATRKEWPLHWSRTLNTECWYVRYVQTQTRTPAAHTTSPARLALHLASYLLYTQSILLHCRAIGC